MWTIADVCAHLAIDRRTLTRWRDAGEFPAPRVMPGGRTVRGPGQGPWKTVDDVELATLGWVTWFNTVRLHGTLNDIPPAEYEAAYHHQTETNHTVGIQ